CGLALGSSTTATLAGNVLTLTMALTFTPSYGGTKNIDIYAANGGTANSGWQRRGTWTIPCGVVSVTVTGSASFTAVGQTSQLTATAQLSNGTTHGYELGDVAIVESKCGNCVQHWTR